ncbi:MAG TPA: hypothetical protein PLM09_15695 [Casimicrobiaceae bacterium]|nr:hypothetical protein [Casimicrobiaceae bacterium]
MTTRNRDNLQPAPLVRAGALVLSFALTALTLGAAMPGGASWVAGRLLPDAGNAFETIASRATEVDIRPGRIEVVGVRAHAKAPDAAAAKRG